MCALLALALTAALLAALPAPAGAASTCAAGRIALTFDDGPSGLNTPRLLDLLAAEQVRATFFVVGDRVDARPDLVRRTALDGHALANHTYRHDRLTHLSDRQIIDTVEATDRAIRRAGAVPVKLVRPPYGLTNQRVRESLALAGYAHIMWSIDPQDWESSASSIQSTVLAGLRDGAVVLLHDGVLNTPQTLAALPGIIDGAHTRGFCFVTLDGRGRLEAASGDVDWRLEGGPYRDVPPTSAHAEAIAWLRDADISRGCGQDRYCPDEHVTRAQMASFLQRALSLPDGTGADYRDVATTAAHAGAIGALRDAGITRGCSDDGRDFCPTVRVRRDQMASFLTRAFELAEGPVDVFRDVEPTSTHAPATGAVHQAGITLGCSDDGREFCPGDQVTRAQMASFLVRALETDVR